MDQHWFGQQQKTINDVTVITSPEQYDNLINELNKFNGKTSLRFRQEMSENALEKQHFMTLVI